MTKLVTGLSAIGVVVYPLVVYFGLIHFESRYVAFYVGALLLFRIISGSAFPLGNMSNSIRYVVVVGILMFGIILYTIGSNRPGGLKLYPVLISFSLMISFAYSLYYPPAVIERLARITEPDLSEVGVKYTHLVTKIWCGFFLLNGLAALYTSFYSSIEVWTLYNGLISYLLVGSLLGGEYLYRYYFLKKV